MGGQQQQQQQHAVASSASSTYNTGGLRAMLSGDPQEGSSRQTSKYRKDSLIRS